MNNKKFYDIHCHAMNLSHPNFMAFLRRFEDTVKKHKFKFFLQVNAMMILYLFFNSSLTNIAGKVAGKAGVSRFINLFSLMESDMGNFFFTIEKCLKEDLLQDGKLVIGDNSYDKIVLTPLMMDFGYKYSPVQEVHYNKKPTNKPIVEQVVDIFNGIKRYCDYETENKGSYENIFEIYPFLGINTKNYTLVKIKDMLKKYFHNYRGDYADIAANMGKFCGDIDKLGGNFFAGIKVYPPLGFDPWPENDPCEMEKLEYLYEYCSQKQIPITAHCGGEGFLAVSKEEYRILTSPEKWSKVLQNFEHLKLNIAHFGGNVCTEWEEIIIDLIRKYDHVYTDFAYRADKAQYYQSLKSMVDGVGDAALKTKLGERILFGSDLTINLMHSNSYCEYLRLFQESDSFTSEEKNLFCSSNPEKFLFNV